MTHVLLLADGAYRPPSPPNVDDHSPRLRVRNHKGRISGKYDNGVRYLVVVERLRQPQSIFYLETIHMRGRRRSTTETRAAS